MTNPSKRFKLLVVGVGGQGALTVTRFLGADRGNNFEHNIQPGRRQALCSLIDVLPTMMDIAGIDKPANLPGTSLLPVQGADPQGGEQSALLA